MKHWLTIYLCISLTFTGLFNSSWGWKASARESGGQKILVDTADTQRLARIEAIGGILLVDYGAFSLWRIPDGAPALDASIPWTPVEPAVHLRGMSIKPPADADSALLSALMQHDTAREQYWLVQFVGPVKDEWLFALLDSGLEIVSYLPDFAYVIWGSQPESVLTRLKDEIGVVEWFGAYRSAYRLETSLHTTALSEAQNEPQDITVQFYNTSQLKESVKQLEAMALMVYQPATTVDRFTIMRVQVRASQIGEISTWPDVFNVEAYHRPQMLDEIQGQILAGNIIASGTRNLPAGPGYLNWLASKGFPTNPNAYPVVVLMDDGLDQGIAESVLHPDFFTAGDKNQPDRVAFIHNCTRSLSGNGVGGHGNLNAGILAGYNGLSGYPYRDTAGYQLGLGISPFGRIASSKIFTDQGLFDYSACSYSYFSLVEMAYRDGARITSNSWGDPSSYGNYTIDAYIYDLLTRDASSAPGNQEMLHVFAAGNNGPSRQTINSPGTAKNVLTVGATENVRGNGINDGCLTWDADNADDIAGYSSRGPTVDERVKPDLVAPGTHVQGPASQDPAYSAAGVCGQIANNGNKEKYYPLNQTLYTWSSGTSHATPAVAGAAQLVYEYYSRVLKPGSTPSPAMLKALLLNAPRYLTGNGARDSLPSASQGWGMANLDQLFDGSARILVDQSMLLTHTGQTYEITGRISDTSQPFRVSLVWTDAAGSTTAGQAYVNNLDLEVTTGNQVYRGNVFTGEFSTPGGNADSKNNVENVFLPANAGSTFRVRVIARNLAGDGVPGNASRLDQDFALVISNGVETPIAVPTVKSAVWSEQVGNGNGAIDPGETAALNLVLSNEGNRAVLNPVGILLMDGQPINRVVDTTAFPTLQPGQSESSIVPLQITISPMIACGGLLPAQLRLTGSGGYQEIIHLPPLLIGKRVIQNYTANNLPANIPDGTSLFDEEALVPIQIESGYTLTDLDVQVNIAHTWDSDLDISLLSPSGTQVYLSQGNGGIGDHYQNTIFDDQAGISIVKGKPPFHGRYKPEYPLALFNGENAAGEWNLRVVDTSPGQTGSVQGFQLTTEHITCEPYEVNFWAEAWPGNRGSGLSGEELTFEIRITNFSSIADGYNITTDSDWFAQVETNVLGAISPKETRAAVVNVRIPADSIPGETKQIVVTVYSQSNPAQRSAVYITIQTIGRYWIPVIQYR